MGLVCSWVKKEMLPALEFIMSKQPRLHMGANNYSYVGVRRENVFRGADRFLKKYNKRDEVQTSGFQVSFCDLSSQLIASCHLLRFVMEWPWRMMLFVLDFGRTKKPLLIKSFPPQNLV